MYKKQIILFIMASLMFSGCRATLGVRAIKNESDEMRFELCIPCIDWSSKW